MEEVKPNELITAAAKTLFSYCRSHTHSKEEAEDLSQDIIFELLKTRGSFCNDKAFYGFMWAVAGNVYKNWCKKRAKVVMTELNEHISDRSVPMIEWLEKEADLRLLYRELGLLTEQYRKVIILYYFDEYNVREISKSLNLSESMVKFLLFKSRKILREGINMERTRGDLSFSPGKLDIHFYGGENFKPENISWDYNNSQIAQNILLACYNDRCTAEEISLQLGVAVPYLENDLQMLCNNHLLVKKGGRYETAVVIFTAAFAAEANEKARMLQSEIAEIVDDFLQKHLADIKAMGFHKGVEEDYLLKWHIATILFNEAVLKKYHNSLNLVYPTKYLGIEAFLVVAEPNPKHNDGASILTPRNKNGDYMFYMGFHMDGVNPCGNYFVFTPSRVNIMLDIARGKMDDFNENDRGEISEFIKRGFVRKTGYKLSLNFPVFTSDQYNKLLALIDSTTTAIAEKTKEMEKLTTDIFVQHTPASMKKEAENMTWIIMIDMAAVAPVKIMLNNGMLQRIPDNTYTAAHVVL